MVPLLSAPKVVKTESDALATPGEDGRERSKIDRGRRWSAYTGATLHPVLAATALGLGGAILAGAALSALRKPAGRAGKRR